MSSEDSNAYSAMCTLHRQIVEALKDGLNEGVSVSTVVARVIDLLNQVNEDLSGDAVTE